MLSNQSAIPLEVLEKEEEVEEMGDRGAAAADGISCSSKPGNTQHTLLQSSQHVLINSTQISSHMR